MKYRKGITLNRTDHPELPWLLNVAKSHFGKQIRLRYPTKELGETAILKYENKLREKERVPLDPEIHKVVSNYQHIFDVDEFRQILEAAVVARPDEKWGETPCAFVTLKDPSVEVSSEEIIQFCQDQMAHYKIPKTVVFLELPKTSTGKIQKHVLREKVMAL